MALKSNANGRWFQEIDMPIKAYFLGYIAADGCVTKLTKSTNGLSITLHEQDIHVLELLKSLMGCTNKIMRLKNNLCRFQLGNNDLFQDLCNIGIVPRKSLILQNVIQYIPKEYRKAFILGYFDGDGSVCLPIDCRKPDMNTKRIAINMRGTYEFLKSIADELELSQYGLKKYDSTYTLSFSKKSEVLKFFDCYNHSPFFLNRKYVKFLQRLY